MFFVHKRHTYIQIIRVWGYRQNTFRRLAIGWETNIYSSSHHNIEQACNNPWPVKYCLGGYGKSRDI